MKFFKYHGAGNDYVLLDAMQSAVNLPPELIRALCHRNLGIGADGVVVFSPSERAACRMTCYNPDASEADFSGNGIRCLAKHLYEEGIHAREELSVETASGLKGLRLVVVEGLVREVEVEMGRPDFRRGSIPMLGEGEEAVEEIIEVDDYTFKATCLSTDNPHCVIFLDALSSSLVREIGPRIERHPLFPLKVNVEFAEVLNMSEMIQRTWERGAGETLSSATGACAAVAAAIRTGKGKGRMFVRQPGGLLEVSAAPDGTYLLKGPVRRVFSGELDPDWWDRSRVWI
jgi:diaminopimelate epimerase